MFENSGKRWGSKNGEANKEDEKNQQSHVQHSTKQLEQQEADYAWNPLDQQTSSQSIPLEQGKISKGSGKKWGSKNGEANKENEKNQQIAKLTSHVQLLTKQLEQQEADYARKLKDLQTSFQGIRLEQSQISDRLAKFERQGFELKKQQEDFNRDVNGTFEKVRREIVGDQESMAKTAREVKNRLDTLDVDKALIMERLKHLREDLSKERGGRGGENGGLMIHERESTVQRMEVELKWLQAESNQQGKFLIGTACGAVLIVAYLLAARV